MNFVSNDICELCFERGIMYKPAQYVCMTNLGRRIKMCNYCFNKSRRIIIESRSI